VDLATTSGRKALAVNFSDVAAMGGIPKFAMMSIALPPSCSSEFIDELFEGMFELAEASSVSIIGGDTSSSRNSLFIDISVIGECESGKAVTAEAQISATGSTSAVRLAHRRLGCHCLKTGSGLRIPKK